MADDQNPAPQQPLPQAPQPTQSSQARPDAGHIPITEELDSAKWTLPPILPVVIALIVIVIIVGAVAYMNRPTPSAVGSITKVISVDEPGNTTMVAVHLKFDNQTEKPLWIRHISAEVETPDGKKLIDDAAPASDIKRYLEGFPELAQDKIDSLQEEQKVAPKGSHAGMTIFAYPIDKKTFDGRKSLSVRVEFYDRAPMVLKQ